MKISMSYRFVFFCLMSIFLCSIEAYAHVHNQKTIDSLTVELNKTKTDTGRVNILNELSYTLPCNDTGKSYYALKALEIAKSIKWNKGIVGAYIRMADFYSECKNNYPQALTWLKKADSLASTTADSGLKVTALSRLADINNSMAEYANAIAYYRQCLALKPAIGEQIGILGNMGLVYHSLGDFSKSLQCYEESYNKDVQYMISAQTHTEQDSLMVMGLLITIADIYFESNQIDKALENYKRVQGYGPKKHYEIIDAWIFAGMGKCYHQMNKDSVSIEFYEKALDKSKELKDYQDESRILNEMGALYLDDGNLDKAMDLTRQSLAIAEGKAGNDAISEDLTQQSLTGITLGKIYTRQKEYKKALVYLQDAIGICKKTGALNNEKEAWLALNNTYDKMNKCSEAYAAYKQYIAIKDSLFSQDKAREMTRLDMQGDFDRQLLTDSLAQAKKDLDMRSIIVHQRIFTLGGCAGIILVLLLSIFIYRNYTLQMKANIRIAKANKAIIAEKKVSESLLLNILPAAVAEELKLNGKVKANLFNNVSVLITDFVNFTSAGERMTPEELIAELDACFEAFDAITSKYMIEKIKTVGDSYVAVSGLPNPNPDHAVNIIRASIEMRDYIADRRRKYGDASFGIRIGINSGKLVAGIVGVKKFAYDIWGDTVNTAARMEQNSAEGKINISQSTYELVKDKFNCEYRGEIEAKGKGLLRMYYIND